jgi:hypothetical protein
MLYPLSYGGTISPIVYLSRPGVPEDRGENPLPTEPATTPRIGVLYPLSYGGALSPIVYLSGLPVPEAPEASQGSTKDWCRPGEPG